MLISRSMIRLIACLLIGVMLLAQSAVAAYACGSMTRTEGSAVGTSVADAPVSTEVNAFSGHALMDPAQPSMCAAHCQSGQQRAEPKVLSDLPAAVPVALYPHVALVFADAYRCSATALAGQPTLLADPPHAILHCCFRI